MRLDSQAVAKRNRKTQAGLTLMETMVALAMLLVVASGVIGLAAVAVSTTETQGHLAARTAEYGQDKMEQLLALKFCDGGPTGTAGTDTTVFPAVVGTGTGLAGCSDMVNGVPQAGGSLSTTAPTTGYVDYLDASGNLVTAAANWEYIRVWQITVPAGTTHLKQITVLSQARRAVGNGIVPQSTVAALKTYPF
ncbi:MAG TPA: prepilin-type N-terminal cleavage/methylation domain-containing protein [Candidatus Acidoferrum sp.]|nr:prepilin-type N-terminal cleavage/methylation domain-containing protein [Candidatus Acidoferrum sp.]